ncbi:uncharacterized protein LOC135199207 [Macrobrachium nipponense]|uniref:uncharacterized protein LOC135199207 n=1 Tax=Macrobrachium nipponense TaxID=159736 RepID=UPI0030C8A615
METELPCLRMGENEGRPVQTVRVAEGTMRIRAKEGMALEKLPTQTTLDHHQQRITKTRRRCLSNNRPADTKICKRRSGTCRTKCLSGETAKGKCRGKGCMCCITAASCTSTAQCKKAKGKCAAKCKKSEREVPSGCTGDASCLCCGKKCQPKPGCTAAGGTCVEKEADCAGIFQLNGCKFGCHCCAPIPPPTTMPPPTASSSTT